MSPVALIGGRFVPLGQVQVTDPEPGGRNYEGADGHNQFGQLGSGTMISTDTPSG